MALDYLPSPGWAVVYGETPSADRWSELGENDDALALGAGIDDDAIIARHIAAQAVKGEHLDYTSMGNLTINKTNSQTMPANTYQRIQFNNTVDNSTTLLTRNVDTIQNTSGKTLKVLITVAVVYTTNQDFTVRVTKTSDTTNALIFMQSANQRAGSGASIVDFAHNEQIQVEGYYAGTINDVRNRLSVLVLGIVP